MNIWISALLDRFVFISAIVSGIAVLIALTIAKIPKLAVSYRNKLFYKFVCVVLSMGLFVLGTLILFDAAYPELPNVIGRSKDEAQRMIEGQKIITPFFISVPSENELSTIIALFDDQEKALYAGERVPRNIQIVGHYAILPTAKPTATPISKPTAIPTPQPTAVLTPEQTATATATPIPSPEPVAKVGDRLTFGSYQDEAIEWRVLAVEDDRVLVISERMLDARPYNDKFISVTWETSTLRAWLNNDFYRAAFTEAEKARIVETTVMNSDNATYDTAGGNNTLDRVFLLRIEEAENYFSDDKERMAKGTLYAEKQGLLVHNDTETDWWWLRSPGYYTVNAACVYNDGTLHPEGHIVNDDTVGVRPALWLNQ